MPPKIVSDAAVRGELGNQVTCSATGTPPIYIALIRNFTVLMNTTNTASSKLNKKGNYTCVATSKYGTDVKNFVIKVGCGSVVNNTLKNPGYPNNYPPNMECDYMIPIPRNLTMNISFIDFELESHHSCSWDYLEIVNDGRMVGKYCGSRTGQNILLTGDQILIKFHSDANAQRRGFLIHFTAGSHVPPKIVSGAAVRLEPGSQVSCSAIGTPPIYMTLIRNFTVLMNTTDTASSKLYKEGSYTCVATSKYGTDVKHFVIKGVPPKIVSDAAVRLEPGSQVSCSAIGTPPIYITLIRNFTVLTNTTDTASSKLYKEGNYTCVATSKYGTDGKHFVIKGVPPKIVSDAAVRVEPGTQVTCSASGTPPIYIALIRNFTVLLNTTNTASSKLYKEGNYTCVATSKYGTDVKHFIIKGGCRSVVHNTLKSPGYPNNYPPNMNCSYTIPIGRTLTMNISFIDFELEYHPSCDYDYLEIIKNGRMVGKYCGNRAGQNVLLTGGQILITFHSDYGGERRGFLIHFTAGPHVPPKIVSDAAVRVDPGSQVSCSATGTPPIYVALLRNLTVLMNTTDTASSTLYQEGNYTCVATSKYGTDVKRFVIKGVPPKIVDAAVRVEPGSQVTCSAIGTPPIYIALIQNFTVLMNTTNTANSTLYQEGNYTCVATSKYGTDIKLFIIKGVAPMVVFPAALLAIKGGMLSCSARGTPPIYTALIRNSTVLVNTTNTATIRLYNYGNFTCQATNQYGIDVKELQVNYKKYGPEIGFLSSEGYPYSYPRNTDYISPAYPIPEGWYMNIDFQDFDVEESKQCLKDFLRITDGMDKIFGLYCGNKMAGKNLLVTGDKVQIIFHSDDKIERRGYFLNFTLVSPASVSPASASPDSVSSGPASVSPDSVSGVPTEGKADQPTHKTAISSERMIYIASGIAFILLLVLCFILGFWCYRRSHHKRIKRSSRSAREIIPFDKWELLPEQIEHGEELGRGAFGVVYKATLKRRVGIEVFDTEKTLKSEEPCKVVAVKKLQDDASEDQKEEFLHEIEQMKLLGAHQNIVSLVGCCTLQEHKFLVIEYVPFGDLLQWLRRRRRSISRNRGTGGNEEKKCYEDKEIFNAQKEVSEYDQGERDLQDKNQALAIPGGFKVDKEIAMSSGQPSQDKEDDTQDDIDQDQPLLEQALLMMESTPSRDNRDIIIDVTLFSENLAEGNDLLDRENIELMPIPPTSQGNSNAAAILASTENIDDDDVDDDNVNDDDDDADAAADDDDNDDDDDDAADDDDNDDDDGDGEEESTNDLLNHESMELMPMRSTSQGDSSTAAIMMSIENIDDDDNKEDYFRDQERMKLLPMPSTSQENSNASAILISIDNVDDVEDEEEENSSDFLDEERMELLPIPSTSQGNSNTSTILKPTENNDDDDEAAGSFTTQQLFSFAWQIAKGMNHLAEKGFVHRDLAARNILVGNDNRVKVSDFGLMREIYEDVYSGKNTKKLPVKWMAPESINDSIYTIKSDVWSFGILLWEMATMGGTPYPTLTNRELCQLLKTGYRMERPDMCCDEAYELMSECWNEDPSFRPSFSELIDRLEVIMTRDVPYCDLDKHDESRSYYNVPAKADGHSG